MLKKNSEIEKLLSLLKEKHKLLNEILEITNLQTKIIKEQKYDRLNNLINSKQLRIDKINSIDSRFNKAFENIRQEYNIEEIYELDVGNENLIKFKKLTEDMYNIMTQIHQVEKKNNEIIQKDYELVKAKLKQIKKGKQVTSNYYRIPVQIEGYFIDKKK
ncbi:flagellar protein FlgN [Caloranaerobacter ferrireducens]|uniref:flagellar protein FlgN n=1 Tax=Caloranaerobacter ferrireducens TaxID=1323370 RepID=UPI00084DE2DE|nr:flagellar protein FlgN [Caloranaerobacter ferrireducens]